MVNTPEQFLNSGAAASRGRRTNKRNDENQLEKSFTGVAGCVIAEYLCGAAQLRAALAPAEDTKLASYPRNLRTRSKNLPTDRSSTGSSRPKTARTTTRRPGRDPFSQPARERESALR